MEIVCCGVILENCCDIATLAFWANLELYHVPSDLRYPSYRGLSFGPGDPIIEHDDTTHPNRLTNANWDRILPDFALGLVISQVLFENSQG